MYLLQLQSGDRRAAALAVLAFGMIGSLMAAAGDHGYNVRAAAPEGAVHHVLVVILENEGLLKQGELITNYFATSHVSLGNYVSMVSGQESTP